MGDIDRIAKQRAQAVRQAQQDQVTTARQKSAADEAARITWIEAEGLRLVEDLRRIGLPDLDEVTIEFEHRFPVSRTSKKAVGAWVVGSYSYQIRGDDVNGEIYLLSDGRISLRGTDPKYLRMWGKSAEVERALRSFRQGHGL